MTEDLGTRDERHEELAAGLSAIEARITAACHAAGRDRDEVHLIVVTKTWPASDVRILAELGVGDVGENKVGELQGKRAECDQLPGQPPLTWHFIGQIQSNKARDIARSADVVHAVDRAKILPGLARGAQDHLGGLSCLMQVSLDPEPTPGRGGVTPNEAGALADQIAQTPGLVLRGVMGVAPLGGDPAPAFATLREVADQVATAHPQATWISAGMSEDLESAVLAGATHLRVGSAILGSRPPLG